MRERGVQATTIVDWIHLGSRGQSGPGGEECVMYSLVAMTCAMFCASPSVNGSSARLHHRSPHSTDSISCQWSGDRCEL